LANFLDAYFKSNNSGPSLATFYSKPNLSLIIFTGPLNASLSVLPFIHLIPILMPTALLICMENTFWNISTQAGRGGNFVKLFKKSFALYVESGTRKKLAAAIDILRNELGGDQVTKDFKEKYFKIITEHYLRKFHCFFLHSTHLMPQYSPP
jgi:hypothetical protein